MQRQPLPDTMEEAVGLLIQVKETASEVTISNFGIDTKWFFQLKDIEESTILDSGRIRLHPIDEQGFILMDKVHLLITMMDWNDIKEKFDAVGDGFDTNGWIASGHVTKYVSK